MRRLLLALGLIGACVTLTPATALADAPIEQGWWTVTNPGDPVPVAPPSDVQPGNLLVQGGVTSPSAYAGLVYDLDPTQQPRQLVLKVASGSATTPAAALQVCPLKGTSLTAEQGGPMADAPAYDCATVVKADPSTDGTTYTFDARSLAQGSTVAVAVLAAGATDRIVLAKPDTGSLLVTEAAPAPVFSSPPLSDGGASSPPPLQGVSPQLPLPPVGGPVTVPATGPVVAGPAPSFSAAPDAPAVATTLAASHTSGNKPVLAIVLVAALALAAVLWTIAAGRREQDLLDLPA
ncbi:MAG: hypothetical protein ABR549_02770 [Mycobacteriales bacterium]